MAFSVTNTLVDGAVIEASELNQNFTDLVAKINGGLTKDNLTSTAGILNSQLANSQAELVLSMQLHGAELNTAAAGYLVLGGLPYDSTTGTTAYTITGIEHLTYAAAARTAAVFTLQYGNDTDGWTSIKTGVSTGTASGQTRETGFTGTVAADATRPQFFRLDVTTAGVSWASGDSWAISIKLTQALR